MLSKNLPYPALHSIPSDRSPHLAAYGETEPASSGRCRNADDDEVPSSPRSALALHPQVFPALSDACPRWECEIASGYRFARFVGVDTVNRFRPFARLALSTLRPPGLDIRVRKPCLRRRLTLLGWKVRFIATVPRPHDSTCASTHKHLNRSTLSRGSRLVNPAGSALAPVQPNSGFRGLEKSASSTALGAMPS